MSCSSESKKIAAGLLCLLTLLTTVPFSLAETAAGAPLGVLVTTGGARVGGNAAPTGTSLFPGDTVTASKDPLLVSLASGSRIQMTEAAATFSKEGKTLVVEASHGLFRFQFTGAEGVQLDAGKYRFVAEGKAARAGELGINGSGEVVMTLSKGEFTRIDVATGERSKVAAQPGKGMSGTSIAATVAGVSAGAAGLGLLLPKPRPRSPSYR